jgi:hypothetical protein
MRKMPIFSMISSRSVLSVVLLTFNFFLIKVSAETTVAVLNFQNSKSISPQEALIASDRLCEIFKNRSDVVLLESWLVDTMASAQGSLQLLQCRDESCLLAIGHLLVVDFIINGTITKKNNSFDITIVSIDIKKNTAMPPLHFTVNTLENLRDVFSSVPGTLLDNNPVSVIKEESASPVPVITHRKSKFLKNFIIVTVAIALIGGAAGGGYYYYQNHHSSQPEGPAGDVPMDNLPVHPTR